MPSPTPSDLGTWLINFAALATFFAALIGAAVGIRRLFAPSPLSSQPVTQGQLQGQLLELKNSIALCATKEEFAELKTSVAQCVTKTEFADVRQTIKDLDKNLNDTRHALANSQNNVAGKLERLLGALEGVGAIRPKETE